MQVSLDSMEEGKWKNGRVGVDAVEEVGVRVDSSQVGDGLGEGFFAVFGGS
jgi:hypothetical protein